ncbi:MAG: hypothetical protein K2H47_07105 [Muribaculaceae bacterium]|nr:hypothetical protein [Muribaculaceae bacterium]
MKQIFLYGGLPLLAMVSLTGCIDDNYDLSDIDTTSEFKVNDLVLPVNIDVVTLGDIIDIKPEDQIKEITIGDQIFYAVQESGTFASNPIHIPAFSTNAPSIASAAINFNTGGKLMSVSAKLPSVTLALTSPIEKSFSYRANNIDSAIVSLTDLFTDELSIVLTFTASPEITENADIEIQNLLLDLPKGFAGVDILPDGIYSEGRLEIPSVKFENGVATITLNAYGINLVANGCVIDYANHSLELNTNVNIESATLFVTPKANATVTIPESVSLNVDYNISPLAVNAVSGKIHYMLKGNDLNISPISLSNLPDFLAQEGTNLVLSNPQIYLSVNNPVANEKLAYRTGLQLTAIRDNGPEQNFRLDNGYFDISFNKGVTGPYNFCLSPELPAAEMVPNGYVEPVHVPFTSLGNVISGNGLPKSIDIDLVEPQIFEQMVSHFQLGRNLNALEGSWNFIAPLALKSGVGSKIVYTKTNDGWNDEDIDAITISTLEISMTVDSTLPLKADISGYPIDKKGNQISEVTIVGAEIPANAKDKEVVIRINGTVQHLDGIKFTATVEPESDEALSPSQTLTMKNIRAKVSGSYIKKL